MRVAPEFKIFTNALSAVVDPKRFDPKSFVEFTGEVCIVPPNSFALARSVEYFRIPRNVLTICVGKSTYARCGIITNVTPLEPEWEGFVTLEISNTTPLPARIYANEGIAQVLFFTADEGDDALPRRDAQGGREVLDQRAPEAGATRVIAEKPRVHERQSGPRDRGAHRRPQRISDHDLHPVARVGHHDGQMWRPRRGPASRGVNLAPTGPLFVRLAP